MGEDCHDGADKEMTTELINHLSHPKNKIQRGFCRFFFVSPLAYNGVKNERVNGLEEVVGKKEILPLAAGLCRAVLKKHS
jgi:hypothetical protein